LACRITNKLSVNDHTFVYLTLILLLHYRVKGKSRILAAYTREFILVAHALAQNIIARQKSLKICSQPVDYIAYEDIVR